jgi:hypothetical protein
MKFLRDTSALVTAAELAKVVGIDIETVNNWLRNGTISRAPIGGRHFRQRLFSSEEVYKAALTRELVKLGIPPSPASEAVDAVWREWDKKATPEGRKIYAVMFPTKDKWTVGLCWQRIPGGPLYKFQKSIGTKSRDEINLPKQAFAVIPMSDVLERVSNKLSELLGR